MPHEVTGVVSTAKGRPVSLETVLVPDPGPGEGVVRVQACGQCRACRRGRPWFWFATHNATRPMTLCCSAATRSCWAGRARPARPYSDFPTIVASIRDRLLTLPRATVVHAGHGEDTSIGAEAPDLGAWIARGH